MTEQNPLLNHTCPNCGGEIQFEPGTQKVVCRFCRSEFEPEVFRRKDTVLDREQQPDGSSWHYQGTPWHQGEQEGMCVYHCRSCGADIVAQENQGTALCIFCRKPVVITSQFSGTLRPDSIIPFKLRKEQAVKALEGHYLGKRLLPKVFKDTNHISEVKGVYVPFWLFNAKAEAHMNFYGEKIRRWSDARNDYTETSRYLATRAGNLLFKYVPVDGSSAMDDALMESIEPYNVQDAVDFQTIYLTGYYSSKYDVDAETSFVRADERINKSTKAAFTQTVAGYNSVSLQSDTIYLQNRKVTYALLPVWILTTTWKNKEFTFAMNGQTGAFIGDLPLDKGAKARWFWGLTLGITAVVTVVVSLFWTVQGVLV